MNNEEAQKLLLILSGIVIKHENIGTWKPQGILVPKKSNGVGGLVGAWREFWNFLDDSRIGGPRGLVLKFEDIMHNSMNDIVEKHGDIFEGIVKSEEWEPFDDIRQNIAEILSDWEHESIVRWKRILKRRHQFSSERKWNYTSERISLLMCHNYCQFLQTLPKEIIFHICSFLPISLSGCLIFGKQSFVLNSHRKTVYLVLNPDDQTFNYYYLYSSGDVSSKFGCLGTWKLTLWDNIQPVLVLKYTQLTATQKNPQTQTNSGKILKLLRVFFHFQKLKIEAIFSHFILRGNGIMAMTNEEVASTSYEFLPKEWKELCTWPGRIGR